jgi:aminoglycoside phosphotransferase (APT) family kinase protein
MSSSAPPGRLIGSGRAALVYELDADRVLRRYRTAFDVGPEARLMTFLRSVGFPVPEVFDADGADLVMARLHGPDMLADLASKPWRARRHGRTLAALHDRLHEVEAPPDLPHLLGQGRSGQGSRVLHMDLHPGNVMLTADGPVVIDWSNVVAGPPGADVAMATLIMRTSEVDSLPAAVRLAAGIVRSLLVRRFESTVGADPGPYLAEIAAIRLRDPNVRPAEADRLRQVLERGSDPPADPRYRANWPKPGVPSSSSGDDIDLPLVCVVRKPQTGTRRARL